ncbi:MAG TPA: CoA transferase subunit A [Acidimicrobiales bacterium]|jgi:3-oxoacid CoA-transferase subunit A|nr:CoA transferase subunit A [Acidimicrobiales bacterium]
MSAGGTSSTAGGKVFPDAASAIADVPSGASLAVGGFGLCGVPTVLIEALRSSGVDGLSVVSNNCGTDEHGLGLLLASKQIARMTSSYIGENAEFARQYLAGELELELVPQGTLAERLRAGGCGIPAFYTATGVGTAVAEGGLPWRYAPDGSVAVASPPKEVREFGGRRYVLEEAIVCDFALVRAARADTFGNLVFHESARNFNPLCAMAGRVTIAEAEEIVPLGGIDPDEVHLPGIFVQRVVEVPAGTEKPIERRTTRPRREGGS